MAVAQVATRPKPEPRVRTDEPEPEVPEGPRIPWGLAAAVLLVLALAHYGLYLLVSAGARAELAEIAARQGGAVHITAKAPGDPPSASSPAYGPWLETKEHYDDVRSWQEHETHRSWVARGLGFAYLVQVGITIWALFRVAGAQRRRSTGRRR